MHIRYDHLKSAVTQMLFGRTRTGGFHQQCHQAQIQAAWAGKECLRQLLDALPALDGPLVVDPRRDPTPASRAGGPAPWSQ